MDTFFLKRKNRKNVWSNILKAFRILQKLENSLEINNDPIFVYVPDIWKSRIIICTYWKLEFDNPNNISGYQSTLLQSKSRQLHTAIGMNNWLFEKTSIMDKSPMVKRKSRDTGEVLVRSRQAEILERVATRKREEVFIKRANKKNSVANGIAAIGVKSTLLLGK